jgi:hypothetical protein
MFMRFCRLVKGLGFLALTIRHAPFLYAHDMGECVSLPDSTDMFEQVGVYEQGTLSGLPGRRIEFVLQDRTIEGEGSRYSDRVKREEQRRPRTYCPQKRSPCI